MLDTAIWSNTGKAPDNDCWRIRAIHKVAVLPLEVFYIGQLMVTPNARG